MQRRMLGVLSVLFTCSAAPVLAQEAPKISTDVLSGAIQTAVMRAARELSAGAAVSDHLVALPDMGEYNVGVAVVARPAGTFQNYLSHNQITEVYYVVRGSGTQITGTMVDGKPGNPVSKTIGPSQSGTAPLKNSRSSRLGPGDIQVIPPGVAHGWSSIDAGGVDYLIFRVDPHRVLGLQ